jgi:hypothetical protein
VTTREDIRIPQSSFWHKLPIVSLVVGLMSLAAWATEFRGDPQRSMYGYLFAFVCVLSIALGCMFFVIIQHLTRAGWSVAVRRVAEFAMTAMPLFAILFLPIAFLAGDMFPWSHIEAGDHALENKAPYLNMTFFMIRSGIYLFVWVVLGWWFYKISVEQDDGTKPQNTRKLWATSAPAIIFYALTVTFASVDWLMSLQPHWYSTIFGVVFFAGCFLAGLAFMTLVLLGLQSAGALRESVTLEHYHDLGKLMFAFIVFWAYVSFSQFMLYWYANIPEETEFYMHRLEHGWQWVSYAIPVTNFIVPFLFILSRHVKKNKVALACFCVYLLVVHCLELFWLVMPNAGEHGGSLRLGDLTALLGVFSLFLAWVAYLVSRRNIVAIGDPKLKESLAFENF